MAQKDIQAIADYMIQLNESKNAEDKQYEDALKEEEQFVAEEYEELEQEIIDPATLGFIDDSAECGESDDFYSENEETEQTDPLDEDVSDCLDDGKGCIDETEGFGTLTISVYNEDGFGEQFVKDIMKAIPGISAKARNKKDMNGDIVVDINGPYDQLVKAFNFYIGNALDARLSGDDKDEFEASLVFADGDTIAEADYRERVAHCLDPIGVNASTANLVKKDTCALSLVKEEKCKRKAKKMLKALREDDLSDLTDLELDQLDNIKDAIADDELDKLTPEEARIWEIVLNQMGYTTEEWDKLTPEQQEKEFKRSEANNPILSKTGFADAYHAVDPKDHSKRYKIQNSWMVPDREWVQDPDGKGGHVEFRGLKPTAFNPNYTSDDSTYQHPNLLAKKNKERDKEEYDARREDARKRTMKSIRGKDVWSKEDFYKLISTLTDKERKDLYKSLLDDIEATAATPQQAGNETMFIKQLFGKKPTLRDIAKAWDRTFPGVKIYADAVEMALQNAAREATGLGFLSGALPRIEGDPKAKEKFIASFEEQMNSRKGRGGSTMDPERAARKADIKKAVEDAAK